MATKASLYPNYALMKNSPKLEGEGLALRLVAERGVAAKMFLASSPIVLCGAFKIEVESAHTYFFAVPDSPVGTMMGWRAAIPSTQEVRVQIADRAGDVVWEETLDVPCDFEPTVPEVTRKIFGEWRVMGLYVGYFNLDIRQFQGFPEKRGRYRVSASMRHLSSGDLQFHLRKSRLAKGRARPTQPGDATFEPREAPGPEPEKPAGHGGGANPQQICPNCDALGRSEARFCGQCGTGLRQ